MLRSWCDKNGVLYYKLWIRKVPESFFCIERLASSFRGHLQNSSSSRFGRFRLDSHSNEIQLLGFAAGTT